MLDTLATFHLLMSALNVGCSMVEQPAMLDRALTSHPLIAPYVVVAAAGSSIQTVETAFMLPSVRGVTASAAGMRSRTSATTMTQSEATSDGVRDLDLIVGRR